MNKDVKSLFVGLFGVVICLALVLTITSPCSLPTKRYDDTVQVRINEYPVYPWYNGEPLTYVNGDITYIYILSHVGIPAVVELHVVYSNFTGTVTTFGLMPGAYFKVGSTTYEVDRWLTGDNYIKLRIVKE